MGWRGLVRFGVLVAITVPLLPGGTAVASTMLAGAVLAAAALTAALACIGTAAALAIASAGPPLQRRAAAQRDMAARTAFLRITDPDAPGRARPRAPSAA